MVRGGANCPWLPFAAVASGGVKPTLVCPGVCDARPMCPAVLALVAKVAQYCGCSEGMSFFRTLICVPVDGCIAILGSCAVNLELFAGVSTIVLMSGEANDAESTL